MSLKLTKLKSQKEFKRLFNIYISEKVNVSNALRTSNCI